eukprot:5576068-Pleurochrysis_carterae.AAC.1
MQSGKRSVQYTAPVRSTTVDQMSNDAIYVDNLAKRMQFRNNFQPKPRESLKKGGEEQGGGASMRRGLQHAKTKSCQSPSQLKVVKHQ